MPVVIPPFAVLAVTVALTLFSFCCESGTTLSNWTHLSGRFRDWESRF